MRCCASYRISFHLYQIGLLGRVPQPVPRGHRLNGEPYRARRSHLRRTLGHRDCVRKADDADF